MPQKPSLFSFIDNVLHPPSPAVKAALTLLETNNFDTVAAIDPQTLDTALAQPRGLNAEQQADLKFIKTIHETETNLTENSAAVAVGILDREKWFYEGFEAVTADTSSPVAAMVKLEGAKRLRDKSRDLDGDVERTCYSKAWSYTLDVLNRLSALDEPAKTAKTAHMVASFANDTWGIYSDARMIAQIENNPQGAGNMLQALNDQGLLTGPKHLDLILDKHPDDRHKMRCLNEKVDRLKRDGQSDAAAMTLLGLAATHGQPQTRLQKMALDKYLADKRDNQQTKIEQAFILAELQAGALTTVQEMLPDARSIRRFVYDVAEDDATDKKPASRRNLKGIMADDILPAELAGPRIAAVCNYLAGTMLNEIKLDYYSVEPQTCSETVRSSQSSVKLTTYLLDRVLRDDDAGFDAKQSARDMTVGLIHAEDKIGHVMDDLQIERLDQHRAHEEFHQSPDWKRYQQMREWTRYDGREINAVYISNHADITFPSTQRCLDLLSRNIRHEGLQPEEQDEYQELLDKIAAHDKANPPIWETVKEEEKSNFHLVHYADYSYMLVELTKNKSNRDLGLVGHGRSLVKGLIHIGDENTITHGQAIEKKLSGPKMELPKPVYTTPENKVLGIKFGG